MSDARAYVAEFFGTACLVFVGCASVTIGGFGADLPNGALPIALAFGLCLTFLIYAIGPVSGCHLNPAVTLALWVAARFPAARIPGYLISQLAGGLAGAGLLVLILKGRANGYDVSLLGLGQNGWGAGYLGEYNLLAAFATEFVTTFVFLIAIIGAASNEGAKGIAGLSIGISLTAIILCFLNVTGVSLNPARSLGPAAFVGGTALSQLWLFFVAPILGAIVAGLVFRQR